MTDTNNTKDISPAQKSGKSAYLTIIAILLISSVVFGYLYYKETKKIKEVIVELNSSNTEKAEINNQLNEMLAQYDALETNNEELNGKLLEERAKIEEMIAELKKTKSNNAWRINEYKKELKTLREIMKSYIVQIDSLNTQNQVLTAENIKVKTEYNNQVVENQNLSSENSNLSEIVGVAKILKAKNILAEPINKKSKLTKKIKKVEKVRVCFTIIENDVAPLGSRNVYLRIARPDKLIISASENQLFTFEGSNIVYTSARAVDYQRKDLNVCVYWKKDQELIPGIYYVDLFIDGKNIGTSTFELK